MRATLCCGWVLILRKDWSQGRMENHIYLLLFNKSKWDFSGFWGGEGGGIVKSYCFSHLLVFLVGGRNVPGGKGWIQARRQNRKSHMDIHYYGYSWYPLLWNSIIIWEFLVCSYWLRLYYPDPSRRELFVLCYFWKSCFQSRFSFLGFLRFHP